MILFDVFGIPFHFRWFWRTYEKLTQIGWFVCLFVRLCKNVFCSNGNLQENLSLTYCLFRYAAIATHCQRQLPFLFLQSFNHIDQRTYGWWSWWWWNTSHEYIWRIFSLWEFNQIYIDKEKKERNNNNIFWFVVPK